MLYLCGLLISGVQTIVAPVAISAIALSLSLTERTPGILRHRHNVSYEMYLFHFPIIQLAIFTGLNSLPECVSLPVILLVVIILAVAWNVGARKLL